MQLMIFPGLPRRFSLDVQELLRGVLLPSDFLMSVEQLISTREVYSAVMGVGQIERFLPHFIGQIQSVPVRGTLRNWAQNLPPYWKLQILDHFFFELDEVSRGFDEWTKIAGHKNERPHAEEQQQNLALRRDGLEDVSTVGAMFDGGTVEFELMRQDVTMRRAFEKHRVPHLQLPARLFRTKQVFAHAWWVI